jgi:uncharacterized tellurite resistance protein B-like protein
MTRRPPLRHFDDAELEAIAKRLRSIDPRPGSLMTEAATAIRSLAADRRADLAALEEIAAGTFPLPLAEDARAWRAIAGRRKDAATRRLEERGRRHAARAR